MSADNTASPRKMEKEGSEAMNHLVQGKRHMLVQDYPSAVYSLQESVQLFSKHYGETANECGEAYFCYGKALLEMAREETGVLGNAISRDSGEEEDEDGEGEEEDSENAEKSAAEDKDGDEDEDKEEEDENEEEEDESKGNDEKVNDDDNDSEAVSENISNQSPDSTSQTDYPSEPGASGLQKADSDEEVSSLQLAWEVLELAKVIFKRQAEDNKAMQLKTADVLLKLGEVSIESENYKQAVDDLLECLEIQTEYLEPDSRQLAETHYQLGLAHSFDSQFEDAIQCFKNAVGVIEKRIANLKKMILDMGGSSIANQDSIMCIMSDDPVAKAGIEVTELEAILPDIQSKIEDMQDLMRNARKALFEVNMQKLEEANFGNESGTSSSVLGSEALSSRPASTLHTSNISHLVKRKKPDSVADVSSTSDSKRSRVDQTDTSLNGEVSINGCEKKNKETSDKNEVSADTTQ